MVLKIECEQIISNYKIVYFYSVIIMLWFPEAELRTRIKSYSTVSIHSIHRRVLEQQNYPDWKISPIFFSFFLSPGCRIIRKEGRKKRCFILLSQVGNKICFKDLWVIAIVSMFVSLQNANVEILIPKGMAFEGRGVGCD